LLGKVRSVWFFYCFGSWCHWEDVSKNESTFAASIAITSHGTVGFGFSASSPYIYAGSYVTWRDDLVDPGGTVHGSHALKKGIATYTAEDSQGPNRWVERSSISVDQVLESQGSSCFYVYNAYADSKCVENLGVCGEEEGYWATSWMLFCPGKA